MKKWLSAVLLKKMETWKQKEENKREIGWLIVCLAYKPMKIVFLLHKLYSPKLQSAPLSNEKKKKTFLAINVLRIKSTRESKLHIQYVYMYAYTVYYHWASYLIWYSAIFLIICLLDVVEWK